MRVLDFDYVKNLNILPQLVYDWCNDVWKMKSECVLPPKMRMWQGESGRYITMPCVIPELDVAGVKLISRNVDSYQGIPAKNSNIMLQRCSHAGLYGVVDGTWITNMRTGAIAAHSVIEYGKPGFKTLGIMGLGNAARAFMYIFGNIFRGELKVRLLRYKNQAEQFIERFGSEFPWLHFEIVDSCEDVCGCDAVVSAVSYARTTFVEDSVLQPGCIVVPIHTAGFQNCDLTFDKIIIDDHGHVSSFKYYNEFKNRAIEVEAIERGLHPGRENDNERIVAYCGGIALHDIYIAAQLLRIAEERNDLENIVMQQPVERYWI